MTRQRCGWAILFALLVLGPVVPGVMAQDTRGGDQMAEARPTRGGAGMQQLRDALDRLDLTADQRNRIRAVLNQSMTDLRSQRPKLLAMSPEERRLAMRGAIQDVREQIRPILTPEQLQTLRRELGEAPAAGAPVSPDDRPGEGANLGRIEGMIPELGLTDAQIERLRPLIQQTRRQVAELRPALQAGDEEARAQAGILMRDFQQELAAILTPEQLARMQALRGQRARAAQPNPVATWDPTPTVGPASLTDPAGLGIGDSLPDLTLIDLDGPTVHLPSLKGKVLVIVFGSYTSPSFRDRAVALENLREQYQRRGVQFYVIYTREAHADGEWTVSRNEDQGIRIAQPITLDDRKLLARDARTRLNLGTTILVDSMDNAAQDAFGAGENAAFLIGRDGRIVLRQEWFDPYGLEPHLDDALRAPED